jgi:hypothetical protein
MKIGLAVPELIAQSDKHDEVNAGLFNNEGYITRRPTCFPRACPVSDDNGCKYMVDCCTAKLSVYFIHNIRFPYVSRFSRKLNRSECERTVTLCMHFLTCYISLLSSAASVF